MATKRSNGEGAVYRDSERGGWVGQLYIDGRRRKVRAKTKTDVLARLAALARRRSRAPSSTATRRSRSCSRCGASGSSPLDRSARRRGSGTYDGRSPRLDAELGTVRLRRLDVDTVERRSTKSLPAMSRPRPAANAGQR